jgi:hypothetical protein
MRSLLIVTLIVAAGCLAPLLADTPSVRGLVVDPSGLPLPGVTVTLRQSGDDTATITTTDNTGSYTFDDLRPGRYDLGASLDGFNHIERDGLDVSRDELRVDLQLALAAVQQDVTVTAPAPANLLGTPEANEPVTVNRSVMDIAMLPNSQFDDVLPLMPNVVRGPDGQIAVGGARAEAGGLFVNGNSASNPIGGGAGLMLPLHAVETMQVYAGGAPAEYGHATGGVTSVSTRSGSDQFRMTLDSFFPRLYYTDQGVGGVEFWDPNMGMSGPLIKGRVTFQQALSYRYDRNSFTTLAGDDHNLFNALLSWTQVDAQLTRSQHVKAFVGADPRETDHANITAFTPSESTPAVHAGGWNAGVSDAIVWSGALVELSASALETKADVLSDGDGPYVLTHQLAIGTYFDNQQRHARREQVGARATWSTSGHSVVTAGMSVGYAELNQAVQSRPIVMVESDGSIARTISWSSAPPVKVDSTLLSMFVQDRWTVRPWLTIDAGLRYDETTAVSDPAPAPRVGWTIGSGGRTTISGSAGLFADTFPLAALAYPSLPERQIVDSSSEGVDAPVATAGVLASNLHVPQAVRWDTQLTRTAGPWTVRVHYEERHGTRELLVLPGAPVSSARGSAVTPVVLSSDGSSWSRSLETTVGLRRVGGDELYASYVRAATSGDWNTLDATEGTFRDPFVQMNVRGPLPIDVPNRVLVWGVFHLPAQLTLAPFLETRNGFPYVTIDDAWLVASAPGTYRLPWMTTLDLSATRVIPLPRHLPDARIGLKLYNVLSAHTEREVQRDLDRPDFGTTYDPVPRDFSLVFEFLWGHRHGA